MKVLKTIIIIVVLVILVGIGATVIDNALRPSQGKHGEKEAREEINKNSKEDDTLKSLQNVANDTYNNAEALNKSIEKLVLKYISINDTAKVTDIKSLEMDNYGRCLYYVTVDINSAYKKYFYVVIYDIDSKNATFDYTSTSVIEDLDQKPIQKDNAKKYNKWNEPIK